VISFIGNGSLNLIRRSLPEEKMLLLPEIHRTFLAHYNENCTIDTKPYPSVMEFLKTDAPASILTNKPYAPTIRILAHFNLLGRFDHILCGDTAPARKPEPAGLRSILEQVGIAPEHALMVGDDLPDIGVAKATGTPSLALLNGFGDAQELREANPTYTAEDFSAFARMAQQ
jgi:phosphoglycolate phosphatase